MPLQRPDISTQKDAVMPTKSHAEDSKGNLNFSSAAYLVRLAKQKKRAGHSFLHVITHSCWHRNSGTIFEQGFASLLGWMRSLQAHVKSDLK